MRNHRSTALVAVCAAALAAGCAGRAVPEPGEGGPQPTTGDSVEIVVASTTDVHGRLRGWDYYADAADSLRGIARAATIIDSVRGAHPGRVVLVDAGDALQGNPLTYVAARVDSTPPHPVIAAMNAMRYDAAAIGNHEFNYGLPTLRRAIAGAQFPHLAANAYTTGGERAFPASRIVTRAGVRVAIVGATTPGAMIWDRDNLAGRLVIRDIVPELRRAVADVRGRADLVTVVMHSGLGEPSSYDTVSTGLPSENVAARVAREVPGVDLIVFGHSHREVADTVMNGVMLVQPRNWATSVSVASITLARQGAAWRVASKRGVIVRAVGHREHEAVVATTARAHEATLRYVNRTLGTTPVAWRADSARVVDSPLIDFLLEVQRRSAGAELAATAAFDIGATLDAGPITVAEVARLYPYDNTLRAVRVTGRQLRAFLEYSARYYRQSGTPLAAQSIVDPSVAGYNFDIIAGADYTLDISRPLGQRVTRLEVKGRAVQDADSFTLALNNYRQSGGGGYAMLRDAPVLYDRQEEIRELLIAEVQRKGTLLPGDYATTNWTLEPAEARAAAYRAMHAAPFDAPGTPRAAGSHLTSGRWLRILATNDFHGALEPRADAGGVWRGGAAHLATAIHRARAECPPPTCVSIWLDGGDEFQGTPASNLAFGNPVIELFRRLSLSASALGNHEFDWGVDSLRAIMRAAPYAILGANVTDRLGKDVDWIRNDTIVDLEGVRVGVVGVATVETPRVTRASNVAALRFVDPAPVVDRAARSLRARGADLVVVVAHAGAFCGRSEAGGCKGEIVDLAQRLTEKVDAIVSGHTHSPVTTRVKGIPIVQAFSRGSAIGIIDIPLAGGEAPPVALRSIVSDSIPADSTVAPWLAAVVARTSAEMGVEVTTLAERMAPGLAGTLGNLITDAQRAQGKGDVAIMNRGGVRAPLPAGVVTRGMLFEAQPFGNVLVRISVRGAELREYLERLVGRDEINFYLSGVRVSYDPSAPKGKRITALAFADGRPFDPRRVYRLVMLDFLATGGDGLGLTERAIAVEELGVLDVDALERYLRSLAPPVRAPTDARLVPLKP